MEDRDIKTVMKQLRNFTSRYNAPAVSQVADETRNPYKILISCLLSLRTKDAVTKSSTERLFSLADNPKDMLKIPVEKIENAIYPVGFYHRKAETILNISSILLKEYKGIVPDNFENLLKLPGVGRKTANIILTMAYHKPSIAVDTHVHRITNRWGFVSTRNPEETEKELKKNLPQEFWIDINNILVTFGQNLCLPVSPICSKCPIIFFCDRKGIVRNR